MPAMPVEVQRSLVLWMPDWPIIAALTDPLTPVTGDAAIAVVERNVVVSCSASARLAGVRRGQRRRDAQSRCAHLTVLAADAARDQRMFAPIVARIEHDAPGVQIVRPGLCALRAKGPARYYGGEFMAAERLRGAAIEAGVIDVRAAVADGHFTAQQAARVATTMADAVRVVPQGLSADFLAPLPITALDDNNLADLLARLGVQTLGQFAALELDRVAERLGPHGVRLHELAAGADSVPVQPRVPPVELAKEVFFEPPLELADQVAFAVRRTAEDFLAGLGEQLLVCTELRVELWGERGERSERVWLHPSAFDAAAIVDRVRWQLAEDARGLRSAVAHVRLSPEAVDAASHHARGLFGGGPDAKVHHALSRVQAMLGHRGVLTPAIGGGRWLAERQQLVPWGDRVALAKERARPWPGQVTSLLPSAVYPEPVAVRVQDARRETVDVNDRGAVSAAPVTLITAEGARGILSWAGPWPVIEREWDTERGRLAHRFQVVDDTQQAWLLICEYGEWSAEARYD